MGGDSLETMLNRARGHLAGEVAAGGPDIDYRARIDRAAEQVYSVIAKGLAADETIEIWAEKGNGRILKIGRIGPRKGTRFPFARFRHLSYDASPQLFEECEMVVIVEFQVRSA
jgi:hypothetical protein